MPADTVLPIVENPPRLRLVSPWHDVARDWAEPTRPCHEAFHHTIVGWGEPLKFEFASEKNRQYLVAFGLIEGYHDRLGKRPLDLRIEGKTVGTVDLVREHGRNTPVYGDWNAR